MDFGLSEEQRLLHESLVRYLEAEVPVSRVREIAARDDGHDPALWSKLAEMGVLGVLVPEAAGGSGLGLLDAAVAATALGRCVAPAAFLGTAVMAVIALREAGSDAQRSEWMSRIAAGEVRIAVAATELFARRAGTGFHAESGKLSGRSILVLDACADAILCPTPDGRIALVASDAPGLGVEPVETIDRTRRFAEIVAENVAPTEWLGGGEARPGALRRMIDAGRVIVAADALGASERALEKAVAYARERVQFGRPIGSFQAVKHLCAEMAAELEPARSLVWYAAHAFDAIPAEASLVAAHAKAHLCEIGTFIVRTATEVHGGIGFTDAHDLHLWFKRVGADRQMLGSPDAAREDAARQQGWV
ncbi:acyl-CoA dehydrogenase [Myxococcaceae bacterium]|nr:acyl-CoA dehydrogenase [Myxococcaceae bacterium]